MTGFIASASGMRPLPAAAGRRLHDYLHLTLLYGFLAFTLIGTRPFEEASVAARSDGNILDRLAVIGLVALALAVLAGRWRLALSMVWRNLPILLVVTFCMASIFWSDYPDLTLRRGMLLIFLTVIALGIAVGTDDAARLHRILFATLAFVILLNLLGTALMPSRSITPIGVKGLYTQKNVAGIVGMITVLVGVAFIIGATSVKARVWAILAIVAAGFFLVITRSKTSVNLAVLGAGGLIFFTLCERWGRYFILASFAVAMAIVTAALVWLAMLDFDTTDALAQIIGDTSFTGRDELWAFVRRDLERRYWLGHGYGAFWDVGWAADPLVRAEPGSWLASVEIGIINQAHQGYLELWLHIGRPAMIVAAVLVAAYGIYGVIFAISADASAQLRTFIGAMAALLLIHLVHNLTEATLFMRGSIFWNLATLAIFCISRARDFQRQENKREWAT